MNPLFEIFYLSNQNLVRKHKSYDRLKLTWIAKVDDTSASNNSQKCGWSISNAKTPGEGSVIILLKLSSVHSLTALRNEGTKKFAACIVYSSLCRGCKDEKKMRRKKINTNKKELSLQRKRKTREKYEQIVRDLVLILLKDTLFPWDLLLFFFPPDATIFKHSPKVKNNHTPWRSNDQRIWKLLIPNPSTTTQEKNLTTQNQLHKISQRIYLEHRVRHVHTFNGFTSCTKKPNTRLPPLHLSHSLFQGDISHFQEIPSTIQRGAKITPQVTSNLVTKEEIINKLSIMLTNSMPIKNYATSHPIIQVADQSKNTWKGALGTQIPHQGKDNFCHVKAE